jgi:hypothetical protein
MMNTNTKGLLPFTGTVEQLLAHANTIDPHWVEAVLNEREAGPTITDTEAIALIKSEAQLSDSPEDNEFAQDILREIKLTECRERCANLVANGLIEISDNSDPENPKFRLTADGKLVAKKLISENGLTDLK